MTGPEHERVARLVGWLHVAILAFGPGLLVATAYDHAWWGEAVRSVGVAIAVVCSLAALVWVIQTGGNPRQGP